MAGTDEPSTVPRLKSVVVDEYWPGRGKLGIPFHLVHEGLNHERIEDPRVIVQEKNVGTRRRMDPGIARRGVPLVRRVPQDSNGMELNSDLVGRPIN